jgi:hypothetical protein
VRTIRDHQRGRVYAWEQRVIAPHDRTEIARNQAQAMVNAIWADLGLRYPPKVAPLPGRATTLIGRADRLTIELAARVPSWCLLHELAHTVTSSVEGGSDGHGARFLAAYVALLARYLRLDEAALRQSAKEAGLAVDPAFSFDEAAFRA